MVHLQPGSGWKRHFQPRSVDLHSKARVQCALSWERRWLSSFQSAVQSALSREMRARRWLWGFLTVHQLGESWTVNVLEVQILESFRGNTQPPSTSFGWKKMEQQKKRVVSQHVLSHFGELVSTWTYFFQPPTSPNGSVPDCGHITCSGYWSRWFLEEWVDKPNTSESNWSISIGRYIIPYCYTYTFQDVHMDIIYIIYIYFNFAPINHVVHLPTHSRASTLLNFCLKRFYKVALSPNITVFPLVVPSIFEGRIPIDKKKGYPILGGPSNHWTTGHPNVTSKTCMRLYDAYFPDLAGIRSLTPDPVLGGFRWWKTIPNWPSITQGFERSRTRSCCRTGHAGSRDTLQWWARHLPLWDERWERLETCQPAGGPNSQPSSTCRMFQEVLFF